MNILNKFLHKSFAKLRHNCTVSNESIVPIIQTAAETQDFMENSSKKLGNKPNADTIFNRIKSSDEKIFEKSFFVYS